MFSQVGWARFCAHAGKAPYFTITIALIFDYWQPIAWAQKRAHPTRLQKFIDLEFGIPQVNGEAFTNVLLTKFKLDAVFAARVDREAPYNRQNFLEYFSKIADVCEMDLRARERCVVRLKIVLDQTPSDHYFDPILVAILIALRMKNQPLFRTLARGLSGPADVIAYLRGLPGGDETVADRIGIVLESVLIQSDPNAKRKLETIDRIKEMTSSTTISNEERERCLELHQFINRLSQGFRMSMPSISSIAEKVDIASGIH